MGTYEDKERTDKVSGGQLTIGGHRGDKDDQRRTTADEDNDTRSDRCEAAHRDQSRVFNRPRRASVGVLCPSGDNSPAVSSVDFLCYATIN